jgi:hypothetical protein
LVIENFGFIGFVRDFEIWIIVGLGCLENPWKLQKNRWNLTKNINWFPLGPKTSKRG